VVEEGADAERLERRAVTREPDAAVKPVEALGEGEGRARRERVARGTLAGCLERVVEIDAPELAGPALPDRELEDAAVFQGGVGVVVRIRGARAQREDEQVGGDEDDRRRSGHGNEPFARAGKEPADRNRHERGQGQVRQGDEASWNARVAQRRERGPELLVERQVRPEREEERHDGGEPEHEREAAAAAPHDEAQDGERRRQPAHVDELLEPVETPPAQEVEPVR
jgi:hypothetical protein